MALIVQLSATGVGWEADNATGSKANAGLPGISISVDQGNKRQTQTGIVQEAKEFPTPLECL